jgi:hypothetical protein
MLATVMVAIGEQAKAADSACNAMIILHRGAPSIHRRFNAISFRLPIHLLIIPADKTAMQEYIKAFGPCQARGSRCSH